MSTKTTSYDEKVAKAIQDARQRLLDLSRRNRMINYRQRKTWTLQIIDELPAEVYDILVLREQAMQFKPTAAKLSSSKKTVVDLANDLIEEFGVDESELWTLSDPISEIESRHTDRFLQTKMEAEHLQKRLFRISNTAKAFFEEQGYSILYLATGFLTWREAESSDITNTSPLILIPVELTRARAGASYKLTWTGDEIFTNVSLKEKLKEQNVDLPEFIMPEEKLGIDGYFKAVQQAVRGKVNWSVGEDLLLDFFSFAKFVMWKDLDETNWRENEKPHNHLVLHEVFTGRTEASLAPELPEQQIDEKLKSRDTHHVVDADPSQICVIEAIKAGGNLVVEGPPGTGKSQTIVNTIAELLAQGKRVLFVSEKMAALEVVKRRLDEAGIGLFCLELHSHKTKKKSFIDALNLTLESAKPGHLGSTYEYDDIERQKAELNSFAEVLRTPIGNAKLTPYRLYSIAEKSRRYFDSSNREAIKTWMGNASEMSHEDIRKAHRSLALLADQIRQMHPLGKHPWAATCPTSIVLAADVHETESQIGLLIKHLDQLESRINELVSEVGISTPLNAKETQRSLVAARVVMESEPNDIAVLTNNEWNKPNEAAQQLIHILESYQARERELETKFRLSDFSQQPSHSLDQFRQEAAKPLHAFRPSYWKSRATLRNLYIVRPPKGSSEIIADYEKLIECISMRNQIIEEDNQGKALFGSHWKGLDGDTQRLREFSNWIVSFRKDILSKVLTNEAIHVVSNGVSRSDIKSVIDQIAGSIDLLYVEIEKLREIVKFEWSLLEATNIDDCDFTKLRHKLMVWLARIDLLMEWSRYTRIRDESEFQKLGSILELIECGELSIPDDFVPAFDLSFSTSLLDKTIRANKTLANFSAEVHGGRIRDFRKLDKDILRLNKSRLTNKLFENLPNIETTRRGDDAFRLLKHELGKKQRHVPIRSLLSKCGQIIQQIKPCFMMSPLSVAQFIDPKGLKFDVVLFDEASQVRTEDALGPAIRGAQLIVMGDTKQLPPTSFFDKIADSEGDEDEVEEIAEKNESILQRCKTTFPTRELRWHYRSKHESLIALSNIEFYTNNLNVFPASHAKVEHLGMKLVHLPETVWDRGKGKSRTNLKEAEAITRFVVAQLKKAPDKSIGVATFNKNQAEKIWELLEAQRRQFPEIEGAFSDDAKEPVFVKNLESIQGDERDIIVVSVGYGRDGLGKITQNFGPINSLGGENRLNVLFTRAKEQCIIFSNITSADIRLSEGKEERGVAVFKKFLEYAETGEVPVFEQALTETDSEFEDSVMDFLQESGHTVQAQVGCAGYRIDLAIVHPKRQGTYALGIECDGATYHSSRVARERDRQRQEVLENLNWKLYRVWSTDWYIDRENAKKKLLREVENAILLT